MPGDGGAGNPCRTAVRLAQTAEEQSNDRRPLECGDSERPCGFLFSVGAPPIYMTEFGIYDRQNDVMVNVELARILQADREREIEAALRKRRLLRPADSTDNAFVERRTDASESDRLSARALPVARSHEIRDLDDALADLFRLDDLEVGADAQQQAGDLVRVVEGHPEADLTWTVRIG